MFIRLVPDFAVAPQIAPEDVAEAAAQGFRLIVNNRPDGEERGQPAGDAIEAAARAAGLGYVAVPVDHSGLSLEQVDQLAAAIEGAGGPVLAYCRSGTRSAMLWALAAAKRGMDPAAVASAARAGGYEVGQLLPAMRQLAGGAAPS